MIVGFNATTAFLLRIGIAVACGVLPSVSMPPRRSCFDGSIHRYRPAGVVSMPPRRSCFDGSIHRYRPAGVVSMPPRRSCFKTASKFTLIPNRSSFNATTAFLLPLGAMLGGLGMMGFQCHHGVPASRLARRVLDGEDPFQCHHGVPASSRIFLLFLQSG